MRGKQPSANLRVKLANYKHLAADVVHPNLQEEAWAMEAVVVVEEGRRGRSDSSDSRSSSSHELYGPRHGSDVHHPRDSYLAPALPERGGGAGLIIGQQYGFFTLSFPLSLGSPSLLCL